MLPSFQMSFQGITGRPFFLSLLAFEEVDADLGKLKAGDSGYELKKAEHKRERPPVWGEQAADSFTK